MIQHRYKGHSLRCEREPDSDGFDKLAFVCVLPDGREIDMDVSPYRRLTAEEFAAYVDMEYPTRSFFQSIGPISPDDLRGAAQVAERLNVDRSMPSHLRVACFLAY